VSDCEQLKQHYDAYALGALEGEERAEIDVHLNRGCPICTAELERARWVVAQLAYLAPDAQPPLALRDRVLQAVAAPEPRERRGWIPVWAWASAAALVLLTLYSVRETRRLERQLAQLQAEVQTERSQNQALATNRKAYQQALAILEAPSTKETHLKAAAGSLPEVRAYWNAQLGLVLAGQQIPLPASDRTFQLWVVPKKGDPVSAGIFRPDASGTVLLVATPEGKIAETAALAISEEPAGGRSQPTKDKILWVGPLS